MELTLSLDRPREKLNESILKTLLKLIALI